MTFEFDRFVATHRNTFSKFRRVVLRNIFHLLGPRGKRLILILKRLLKMVNLISFAASRVHVLPYFIILSDYFVMLQLLLRPSQLHMHRCLNLVTCTALIHSHFWETRLFVPLALLLGVMIHQILQNPCLKVNNIRFFLLPVDDSPRWNHCYLYL